MPHRIRWGDRDVVSTDRGPGGTVVIPAFSVGRTQTLLYFFARLKKEGRIPHIPDISGQSDVD